MRENITKNDAISVKSVFMLPKPAVEFSRIGLPGTDILVKSGLSKNWMYYFAYLNDRTNFKSVQIENMDYKKEDGFIDLYTKSTIINQLKIQEKIDLLKNKFTKDYKLNI